PVTLWRALVVARPRRGAIRARDRRPELPRPIRAGRKSDGAVRWELELAGSGLDAGELSGHRIAAAAVLLLWRFAPGGVPRRIGADDDALGGGVRALAPGHRTVLDRPRWAAADARREARAPAGSALSRSRDLF